MNRFPFQLWKRGKFWYIRKPGEKTFHSSKIPATVKEKYARVQIERMI
jgi:hypothetical protein